MSKYIDADRLRAEIKERSLFYAGQANLLADTTTLDGFDEVLALVDFLQQEQSEVDLEDEIDNMWNPLFNLGWDDKSLISINHKGFETVARHFFNLGLNAKKEDKK